MVNRTLERDSEVLKGAILISGAFNIQRQVSQNISEGGRILLCLRKGYDARIDLLLNPQEKCACISIGKYLYCTGGYYVIGLASVY